MFLIPVICAAAVIGAALYRKTDIKTLYKPLAVMIAVQYAVLCSVFFILRHSAAGSDGSLPWLAVLVPCLLSCAPLVLRDFNLPRVKLFLKKLCIASLVVLLTECFVMNLKSFHRDYQREILLPNRFTYEGSYEDESGNVVISGDAKIIMDDLPQYTRAIIVKTLRKKDKDNLPFHAVLGIKDDNFSKTYNTVQETYEMGGQSDCQFSIDPYGKLYSVQISFDSVNKPFTITSVHCLSCFPFAFSLLRFWILLLVCGLVIAVCEFRWYRIRYHRRKPLHVALVAVTVLVCVLMTNMFSRPEEEMVKYEGTPSYTDPFAMTFDAFQKKQVWLDLEVDPLLLEAENVYDRGVRDETGGRVFWDYSFHDGHYYCYFGVTPVITYYMPFYKLHGKLPTFSMATLFFARLAVLFMCLTILELLRKYRSRPNLLLLLLFLPAASVLMGAYWFVAIGGMYNLPNAAGHCFLFLCLWTGLLACCVKPMPLRLGLLGIGGTALAFCAGARPPHALSAVILVPFFVGILLSKRQKLSHKLMQTAAFLIPVCIGAGLIMRYNQARFGSPLDFGAAYQLTVSNINANRMRLTDLWAAILDYFFLTPRPRATFPFFEPQFGNFYNFQHYLYVAGTVGWLWYPFIAISTLLMPKELASRGFRCTHCHTAGWERKTAVILCFVAAVLLAWFDFCMGGVNQRYYYDVAPLLLLGCMVVLFRSARKPEKNRYFYGILCLSVVASSFLAWVILIGYRDSNLVRHCQTLYNTIEELVVFWQ